MNYIQNPYEHLKEYCSKKNIPLSSMDIKINDYITILTTLSNDQKEFFKEDLDEFLDDEAYLGCHKITQKFDVDFVQAKTPMCDFKLAADKSLLKCAAVFYHELCDIDQPNEVLVAEISQNILKKCLKAGILIGIRTVYNEDKIYEVVNQLKEGASKVQLNIAMGVAAIEGKRAKMIESYKNKPKQQISRERGFMHALNAGDLVLEYIYAIPSKEGRNLRGNLIIPEEIKPSTNVPFRVDESIEAKESPSGVKFYAAKPGFIEYSRRSNSYSIKEEMQIKSATFRSTGSIDGGGIDKNVTLNIEENDILKDAVGPNVTLQVAKLNVTGSVAQNAVVKAGVANIGGQTHSKSEIYANEISIASHRGYAKGESVYVARLEGGIIEAQHVKVGSALGGKIIAKEVEIEEALGNTLCEVSYRAKIIKNTGENNRFIISAAKDLNLRAKVEKLEQENEKRALILADLPQKISSRRQLVDNNKDSIAAIYEKLREFKSKGIAVPTAFMIKIKEFKSLVSELNNLIAKLEDAKLAQEAADIELNNLQEAIFNTRISCESPWSAACEVRFELISPAKTFTWVSSAGEKAHIIKLARDLNGEIYIKRAKDDSDD